MKRSTKRIAVAAAALTFVAVAALVPPMGTIDLVNYDDWYHDFGASTLAVQNLLSAGVITQSTLVVFDKKGVEKSRAVFTEAVGKDDVRISYFEKGWAILRVDGDTNIYYSVKVGRIITVLGTNTEYQMSFRFAGKAGVVSYFNATQQAQLFDKKLVPVGTPATLIDRPRGPINNSLNGGTFFYCEAGNQVQVWNVKKGLLLVIQDTGTWNLINEAKHLCCIEDDSTTDVHKLYTYK